MTILGGILLTAVSLAAGWLALWPVRDRLGTRGYHLAAYPTGLLAWPMAVALGSLARVGFQPLPFYALAIGLVFLLARVVRGLEPEPTESRVSVLSFVVWGSTVVGLSAVVSATGITSALYDSLFHFERWGAWLTHTGVLHREIMASYGALIPSVHAINRYFGGDWASTPYPVLSLHVAAIFLVAVRDWSRSRVGTTASWLITIGTTLLLVTTPRYVHHSVYVHGHMFAAAYLILALYAVQRAYLEGGRTTASPSAGSRLSWLLVAGLASAGVALGRADGIAYMLVPALTATLVWWDGRHAKREQLVFLGGAALPVAVVYGSALLQLHFWRAKKLSGKKATLVLAILAAIGITTLWIDKLPGIGSWLRRGKRALISILAIELAALAALAVLRPTDFLVSTSNMLANLLSEGGNGHLWYFAIGAVLVSLFYGGQWRDGRWPGYLLFAISQFFIVAVMVHTAGHPGRLSPNDSFNRVSFHAIPLIFWYVSMVVTSIVAEWTALREGRAS